MCKFATKILTESSRKTPKLLIVDCTKFCLRGFYTSQKSQKFPHFHLKSIFYSHHWIKFYHFSQLIWVQEFCCFSHKINFLFTIHTFNHVVYMENNNKRMIDIVIAMQRNTHWSRLGISDKILLNIFWSAINTTFTWATRFSIWEDGTYLNR